MTGKLSLVLVPGLLCDAAVWRDVSGWLGDIVDINIGDTLRDDTLAAMARRILAEAPRRFALAGLSMGGYVAQEFMRLAPERVEKLALIDTSARPDTEAQAKRRRGFLELSKIGDFKGVTPRLLPLLIHPDRVDDDALADEVMSMAGRVGRDAFIRQQGAILDRADGLKDLVRYDLPVMVACGRQDTLTPLDLHEELAAAISGARLCVIEECGHLPPIERPHAMTALMRDWLLRN